MQEIYYLCIKSLQRLKHGILKTYRVIFVDSLFCIENLMENRTISPTFPVMLLYVPFMAHFRLKNGA